MNRNLMIMFLALAAYVGLDSFYVVQEGELAVITRFGQIQMARTAPGPYFKVPFADTVNRMEKRVLSSDTPPDEYLTLDKKRLVADPITRWRITQPKTFVKVMRSESNAKARIDDIVKSELHEEIASHNFGDIIGNSRQPLMVDVAESARNKVKRFGIHLVDVQIKRADLPRQVEESVFQRMRAERDRKVKKYRSEGFEESARIKADTDKEKEVLLAKAYEEAQALIGEGDAKGLKIYADAFGKDAEFYSFTRSLEAYEKAIDEKTNVVLSTSSEVLKYVGKLD